MGRNEAKGTPAVPKRILASLLASVSAGVVPRAGAPYIAIGRKEELSSLLTSIDGVAEGGATVRFLIGRYGSGKSFLMGLIRANAQEKGFITADSDLSPERRLSGEGGLASYRELARRADCSKGFQAVGQANGKNPLPILIPCHRVIGANGSLTGYAGGVEKKEFLLNFEKDHLKFSGLISDPYAHSAYRVEFQLF